jgi:hypothetical protein
MEPKAFLIRWEVRSEDADADADEDVDGRPSFFPLRLPWEATLLSRPCLELEMEF